MDVMEHLQVLGLRVRDKVTGLEGIVTTVGFDLYGCVQCIVNPGLGKDEKPGELAWFDYKRLLVLTDVPVMEVPTFADVPGGYNKPVPRS